MGPPFTSFTVDSVTTLSPGQPATVTATFDGTFVRFAFGIPQGQQGTQGNNGNNGNNGNDGSPGLQGPPCEATASQLAAAIATTSSNSIIVPTRPTPYADPDAEELRQTLNALILQLRR